MSLEKIGDKTIIEQTVLVSKCDVVDGIYKGKNIGLRASNGISSVKDINGNFASIKSGQRVTTCCRPIIPFQYDIDDSPQNEQLIIHVNVEITKIKEVECSCKECGWAYEVNKEPPVCECGPEDVWDQGKQPCTIM